MVMICTENIGGAPEQKPAYLPAHPTLFSTNRLPVAVEPARGKFYSRSGLGDLAVVRFYPLRQPNDETNPHRDAMTPSEKKIHNSILWRLMGRGGRFESDTVGLESGTRSAIIVSNNVPLRVKGGYGARHGTQNKLGLFLDDYAFGQSTADYASRERRTLEFLAREAPEDLTPHSLAGFFSYGERFRGKILQANVFRIQGDTRIDEILYDLSNADISTQYFDTIEASKDLGQIFQEAGYRIGQMAGSRIKQLHDTGMPWGRKVDRTNAHWGNFVLYDKKGRTTVGLVDFDASGVDLTSARIKSDLISFEYENLLRWFDGPGVFSVPHDNPKSLNAPALIEDGTHNFSTRPVQAMKQGFKDGYKNSSREWTETAFIIKTIARAQLAQKTLSSQNTLVWSGLHPSGIVPATTSYDLQKTKRSFHQHEAAERARHRSYKRPRKGGRMIIGGF